MIEISLNGSPRELEADARVTELLALLDRERVEVLVEVQGG